MALRQLLTRGLGSQLSSHLAAVGHSTSPTTVVSGAAALAAAVCRDAVATAPSLCGRVRWSTTVQPPEGPSGDLSHLTPEEQELWRKKMIGKTLYRSKQRGFLELDLLVGLWAEQQIPTMSNEDLVAFNFVLDEENPELFKWLTGQLEPPAYLASNPAYTSLRSFVAAQLEANSQAETHATADATWVKGYEDLWQPAHPAIAEAAEKVAAEKEAAKSS